MRWDIFCRVIDNLGDIGVCWRLCADLASRGHLVRLWADDTSALDWMAPGASTGDWPGVQVMDWELSRSPKLLTELDAADVWVESFGCEIPIEFIAARSHSVSATNGVQIPVWINLEYLSAEAYVERSHGLPSPLMHGPAQGWIKHFFYPGFSDRTGGLLREPDLAQRMAKFDATAWLQQHGILRQSGERTVSLFCYEPAALSHLLTQLAKQDGPIRLLATAGRASAAVRFAIESKCKFEPSWNEREILSVAYLPYFNQQDFDHLLWACDLNFVRGEDSIVRAIWAGKPFIWHIYPQEDAAHHAKLEAFLSVMEADASLMHFHRAWNGIVTADLPTLEFEKWALTSQSARARLQQMTDLTTQLVSFAIKNR